MGGVSCSGCRLQRVLQAMSRAYPVVCGSGSPDECVETLVKCRQVRQAYETGSGGARIRRGDEDVEPARWATIGFDSSGRPIEMVFVRGTGRSVLVIHANWLTKGFLAQMRRSR